MNFCQVCGGYLEPLGLSGWSSGVWYYGCPKCDILWEEHGCSITGVKTGWKKNFQKLSEWKKREEERKTKKREKFQRLEEQKVCRAKLKKEGFPDLVEISEDVINSFSEEQKQIISRLIDLTEQEKKLVAEINGRRPNGSGILVESGAITICEDEDDWKVITMKSRLELKEVREKIAQNLNEALNSKLAHLGTIQKHCAKYGVEP